MEQKINDAIQWGVFRNQNYAVSKTVLPSRAGKHCFDRDHQRFSRERFKEPRFRRQLIQPLYDMNCNHHADDFPPFETYLLKTYSCAQVEDTHIYGLRAESFSMFTLLTYGVYAALLAVIAWQDLRIGESKSFFKA